MNYTKTPSNSQSYIQAVYVDCYDNTLDIDSDS